MAGSGTIIDVALQASHISPRDRTQDSESDSDEDYGLGYNPQLPEDGGHDAQLEQVRKESKQKLRGRYEHIFQKYGRDFEGIGDEIDMVTGDIVVDNGHLSGMQHEVDAGRGDILDLSRTFEEGSDDDDGDDSSLESEEEGTPAQPQQDGSGDDYQGSVASEEPDLDFSWQNDTAESLTSPDEDSDAIIRKTGKEILPAPRKSRSEKGRDDRVHKAAHGSSTASTQDESPDDIFGQMPGFKDSMLALKQKYKRGQDIAPDDIQALGLSIANQLATFMKGGKGSKNKRKRFHSPDEASSSRGRRRTRSSDIVEPIVEPVAPTPDRSPGSKSLWAPMKRPKTRGAPKREVSAPKQNEAPELDVHETTEIDPESDIDELAGPSRSCAHCKTMQTIGWRTGPNKMNLCNSCGMYYYRYGFLRSLREKASPHKPVVKEPRKSMGTYKANTSRPLDGINLHGLPFSAREDAQILKLREVDHLPWDSVAVHHPGRSPFALQCRYSKVLHGRETEARTILIERGYEFYPDAHGIVVAHKREGFTDKEEDLLLKLREEDGLDWETIRKSFPGRTAEDVEQRFDQMVKQYLDGSDEGVAEPSRGRRGRSISRRSITPYTAAEDEMIVKLREQDKLSWEDLAKRIPGRSTSTVQKRYSRNSIASRSPTPAASGSQDRSSRASTPGARERRTSYTAEEDAKILQLRNGDGLAFSKIAEHFPGKSTSAVSGRYHYMTNKADSAPGSRSGSVARGPGGYGESLESEAVINAEGSISDNVVAPEETFTSHEDSIIVQLREVESLSWDQIAVEMPGRTVSSISCRYYQYLLPHKVPEMQEPGQTPALLHTPESTGNSTDGRVSSQSANTVNSKKRKAKTPVAKRTTAMRRSDPPMLRKALQKGLNKRSTVGAAIRNQTTDLGAMTDGASEELLDDELAAEVTAFPEPPPLPSAVPDMVDVNMPDTEATLNDTAPDRDGEGIACPETPYRSAQQSYLQSGPTPLDTMNYFTPARYRNKKQPYFFGREESPEHEVDPSLEEEVTSDMHTSHGADHNESKQDDAIRFDRRTSRKRRRAPNPTRTARPRVSLIDDDDDEDDDLEGEYFTSRKKRRDPNKDDALKTFRGPSRAKVFANESEEEQEPVTVSKRRSPFIPDSEAESEVEIEMPDLGSESDNEADDNEEEPESDPDDRVAEKPRHRERSPLFDPQHTIDAVAARKAQGPRTKERVVGEEDFSVLPPEHRTRPAITWAELNFKALKAHVADGLTSSEIYTYVEQQYPYFSISNCSWRDSIRNNLSNRPEFVKDSNGPAHGARWFLKDPDLEKVVVLKPGGQKGRRKKVPEVVEDKPKKKMGRPTNKSKGLGLTRFYNRVYIPAAERKRMEAEAEAAAAAGIGDPEEAPGNVGEDDATAASEEPELLPQSLSAGAADLFTRMFADVPTAIQGGNRSSAPMHSTTSRDVVMPQTTMPQTPTCAAPKAALTATRDDPKGSGPASKPTSKTKKTSAKNAKPINRPISTVPVKSTYMSTVGPTSGFKALAPAPLAPKPPPIFSHSTGPMMGAPREYAGNLTGWNLEEEDELA